MKFDKLPILFRMTSECYDRVRRRKSKAAQIMKRIWEEMEYHAWQLSEIRGLDLWLDSVFVDMEEGQIHAHFTVPANINFGLFGEGRDLVHVESPRLPKPAKQ